MGFYFDPVAATLYVLAFVGLWFTIRVFQRRDEPTNNP
jgi:hypothetical protein